MTKRIVQVEVVDADYEITDFVEEDDRKTWDNASTYREERCFIQSSLAVEVVDLRLTKPNGRQRSFLGSGRSHGAD